MNYQGSYLFSDVESDLLVMKECLIKANSIVQSIYAKRHRADIETLIKNTKQMLKFYSLWKNLQKLWAYMTPIFYGSDLA